MDKFELMTEEELDRELRAHGVDPEQLIQNAFQKVCVLARKQAEALAAIKKTHWEADQGKTHWDGCWRDHYRCAMTRIEELLHACRAQREAIDRLFVRLALADPAFFPSQSGQPWKALMEGNQAIRATAGEER